MQTPLIHRGPGIPSQVALLVRELIVSGEYPEDSCLPSEPQLAEMFGVSRASIRQAMAVLEREGRIVRQPGAGTFVRRQWTVGNRLNENCGVTELITSAGLLPGTDSLEVTERAAEADERTALELPEGALVTAIERVRTADKNPVVYTMDVIPFVEPALSQKLSGLEHGGSLYEMLKDLFGIYVDHAVATLEPVAATRPLAAALNVSHRAALLCLRQVDYTSANRGVVYSTEYHVAGAFHFSVYRDGPR